MPDRPPADHAREIPDGPPFDVELVADLHAGVLPTDVSAALWPRVLADPDAARVVAALESTRADLENDEVVPEEPPPAVLAAIASTLDTIRADTTRADTTAPADAGSPTTDEDPASFTDAFDRRRDARRRRGMVIASVAAGIVAVVTLVVAVLTATSSSQGSVERADEPGASISATPTGPGVPAGTLLSFVGRTDAPFAGGAAAPAQRLQRCLTANGVPASAGVVGSGGVRLDGRPAIAVLLSTGVAGRFDVLVVAPDCDAGRPATISRTSLGSTLPTG